MDWYLTNWTMEQNRAVQESDLSRHVKTFAANGAKVEKAAATDEPRDGKAGKRGEGKSRSDSPPT